MSIASYFTSRSNPSYNGSRPFVLVDIDKDDPTRGDTHGYIGLARRVAEKTGADFLFLNREILEGMYPEIQVDDDYSVGKARHQRLQKLFKTRGYPDFIFSHLSFQTIEDLDQHGSGLIIQSINESICEGLFGSRRLLKKYPGSIVPHHLSPEILAWEGEKFAREFGELPRPFIGVNLAGLDASEVKPLGEALVALKDAYETATFFICSCHRTCSFNHEALLGLLKTGFSGCKDRFPVIDFDYKFQMENYGPTEVWNIYAGLIAAADHLIVTSGSQSMISEPLITGRTVHTTGSKFRDLMKKGYLKDLFCHKKGKPLETGTFEPVDITGDCADEIIRQQAEHRASGHYGFFNQLKNFVTTRIFRQPCNPRADYRIII